MGDISVNLSCPSCGGAIAVEEGARLTNCKYCDALLNVEGEGGVFKATFKNKVNDQQASVSNSLSRVKRWGGPP